MPSDDATALSATLHSELRDLAAALLRRERRDHTLQPTALVHEAFLRLGERLGPTWREEHGEAAFRALAATAMRRILVDHARAHTADKRGGGWMRIELPEAMVEAPEPVELLALHEALEALAQLDPRKARVVELRFFGGLNGDEVAETLGVARSTSEADWFMARAWLRKRLVESSS
ncbi:MAG: sigma-70 family RNA polymerase sigma factor [Phycisphaerae bacterium]|nr:sigma-70 family RNA polymerase sigma factor [Phycisphaerae bacterium]